jgi:hypothetical protein
VSCHLSQKTVVNCQLSVTLLQQLSAATVLCHIKLTTFCDRYCVDDDRKLPHLMTDWWLARACSRDHDRL